MKTRLLPLVCLVCVICGALVTSGDARIWTSTSGSTLEGELVNTDGKNVTIRRSSDSQELTLPLTKLCQADQDFVLKMPSGEAGAAKEGGAEAEGASDLAEGWSEGKIGRYKTSYLLYEGASLDQSKKYPLVIYLHGRDSEGLDNRKQLSDGVVDTFINSAEYAKRPCVVLVPQLRKGKYWTSALGDEVMAFAHNLVAEHPIDDKRIYLCGHSTGAVGAWHHMLKRRSSGDGIMIAAVVASGGYVDADRHWDSHTTPVRAFHGDADTFLPIEGMRELVEKSKQRGGNVTYTEIPGEGNDIALKVFSSPEVHDWLFRQVRS